MAYKRSISTQAQNCIGLFCLKTQLVIVWLRCGSVPVDNSVTGIYYEVCVNKLIVDRKDKLGETMSFLTTLY